MEIIVNNSGKKIKLKVRKVGVLFKYLGLMFKSKDTDNLLFEFKRDVNISMHSFFVFFPFLIIWLDSKNKVLMRKIVKPFNIVRLNKSFRKIVEIPFNERNRELIRRLGLSLGKSLYI